MIELIAMEQAMRMEREEQARRHARDAVWIASRRQAVTTTHPLVAATVAVRRNLARALLIVADRLDPRAAVSVPHVPARPTLNGTLHHA